ncbi:MAG: glycolate oxidase subunit GlcF [Methyloligellaceae bacterium]
MQTNFSIKQLADSQTSESNRILRRCVHCGFCTATCPTYQILGDELDSPRGRIYLIKQMLEEDRPADAETVKHIDRCLSCLSCMTTCPSGVHYMHLVDHAREYIEETYKRPVGDRLLRSLLTFLLPKPSMFRLSLRGAQIARPFKGLFPAKLRNMIEMAPKALPKPSVVDRQRVIPAEGKRLKRVALMTGCAQKVLDPDINDATIRILTRHGCEVVIPEDTGCCGALPHHMGKSDASHGYAEKNIRAWQRELEGEGLDAIVINTSGCGTMVKDYGYLYRDHEELSEVSKRLSDITCDITELLMQLDLQPAEKTEALRVTYHAACSLQHGQKITTAPKILLKKAGYEISEPAESHLCCGSAGVYNLLQPELASQLQDRKVGHIRATEPQVIAAGNIGCITQIAAKMEVPVVHTVELLDWATGGPKPKKLSSFNSNIETR